MIIFGTRGVTYSSGSGEFHCPSCNVRREYKHKRVRRFFTLYFIPVIPLDLLGEYIECQVCRGTFNKRVLHYDPQASEKRLEAEFQRGIKRVMVQMLLADGVVDENEIQSVRAIYSKIAQEKISEDDIRAEIETAKSDGRGIEAFLSSLAGSLNSNGKELIVRAAFFIAASDGEFQDKEQALLASIGKSLDMTPAHLRGVINSALSNE